MENEDKDGDKPLDQTPSPKNINEQSIEKIRPTVEIQILKRGPSQNKSRSVKNISFITGTEQADQELSLKLRKEGKITDLGAPFEASDK